MQHVAFEQSSHAGPVRSERRVPVRLDGLDEAIESGTRVGAQGVDPRRPGRVRPVEVAEDLVGRDRLGRANAHLVALDAVTEIGGRSVGGLLVALVSAPVAIGVDAATYLWSAVLLRRVRRPEPRPRPAGSPALRRDVAEGVRHVFGHAVLRPIVLAGTCTNLAIQVCQTMLPVVFVRLGLSGVAIGVFFAVGGAGTLLGSLSAHRLARGLGSGRILWLVGLAIAPTGIGVALVDRGPAFWLAAFAWLVITFKVGVDNVIQVSFRQSVTPDRLLGRMNATVRFVMTGALALGGALAGLLGQFAGVRAALWAGAALFALVWVPTFFSPLRTARALPD
ncbi:MFS transporter [Actinoallomurus rhizosphaericola]|uniref:MFS transporter n=1 Tax=Actinoallomurus rhizosphaericola TaxID=2952536 RepID=UPI002112721A